MFAQQNSYCIKKEINCGDERKIISSRLRRLVYGRRSYGIPRYLAITNVLSNNIKNTVVY